MKISTLNIVSLVYGFIHMYLRGTKKDLLLTTLFLKRNDTLRVYKNCPIDRIYPELPTPN